jgi:hypothetical protein
VLLLAESATATVNEEEPGVVGVPEITPVEEARDKPPGRLPVLTDQAYGEVPPDAARVVLYFVPTVPPGTEDVLIVSGVMVGPVTMALAGALMVNGQRPDLPPTSLVPGT